MKKRIGDILIDKGLATKEQIDNALKLQVTGGRRLGYLLIKMGVVTEDRLIEIVSEQSNVDKIDKIETHLSCPIKKLLPRYLCKKYNALPLEFTKAGALKVAMMNPLDEDAITNIEDYTGYAVEPILAKQSIVSNAIKNKVKFGLKDLKSPTIIKLCSRVSFFVAVGSLLVIIGFLFKSSQETKYGTVTKTDTYTLYKHDNLMINVEDSKLGFLGRGNHSLGNFSVTFNNKDQLQKFVMKKTNIFSPTQVEWVQYIIDNKLN